MYLRHSTVRKSGKKHVYWRLVRSVRRNGKVIQETVAQLGEQDAQGRAKAKALARQITGRGDQCELFENSTSAEATASVRLDQVRVERGRSFWRRLAGLAVVASPAAGRVVRGASSARPRAGAVVHDGGGARHRTPV